MVSRSKQMATSVVGQSVELREEPRIFIASSHSSMYPTKGMAFAFDEDEPPAYIGDHPTRSRDRYSRTHARDGSWRNLPPAPAVYSPPPPRGRDFNPNIQTTELPLRPNRRDDAEFGSENRSPISQVSLLPISATNGSTWVKGGGGSPGKNWLKNIKSPIGESRVYHLVSGPSVC